jgi:hypothetical protein
VCAFLTRCADRGDAVFLAAPTNQHEMPHRVLLVASHKYH